jgi:hypothetical protein
MAALNKGRAQTPEETAVSLIKIFLIMVAFIIGILFFGRFLF